MISKEASSDPNARAKLDCLIIHTPKFNNYYHPLGRFTWINYMPMGLIGLADVLQKNGMSCRVLHQGVEWMVDKSWRLEDSLDRIDTPLVALSLHWHYQAYDVIETCKKIRSHCPSIYIFVGGYTASLYHTELVRDFDCIDGVIRGDGELPLLELAKSVKKAPADLGNAQEITSTHPSPPRGRGQGKGVENATVISWAFLGHVPNLTWRNREGGVVENRLTHRADQKVIDGTCCADMELVQNYRTYIDCITFPFHVLKYIPKERNFKKATVGCGKLFPIALGRGCPLNCTWCAGSLDVQREMISCRDKVVWRSHDAVMADINKAVHYGYQAMYSVFDPTPKPEGQDYFIGLFRRIREEGLAQKLGWMHEATGLASKEFIDEFVRTFPKDFRILGFSPETGNEEVRRLNKGYFYSNEQLFEMLDYATESNVEVEVFLTYGIPGENEDSFLDTVRMRKELKQRYGKRVCVRSMSIEFEPGAPWHINPEKYGIVSSRKTFRDFYEAHGRPAQSTHTGLGYYIPDYFKEPLDPKDPEADFAGRLQSLKCKHLCFARPNIRRDSSPFWGRLFCRTMRVARFLCLKNKERNGDGSIY